jgi:lysophospholipase L1-like esterase
MPTRRRIPRVFKRAFLAIAGLIVAIAVLLGIEIYLAVHRTYDSTHPPLRIGGLFGADADPAMTFVVLGDSTAAGVGAGDAAHAYPTLLAERLASRGRRVRLVDLGISGARTHDVLTDQVPEAIAASPDLVFVGIGANDTTHLTSLGSVRRDMGEILDRLEGTGATVVVAGPPDMHVAAWLQPLRWIAAWRGRQVAAAIAGVARFRGIAVVPLAEDTGRFFAEDPDRYYSADLFHPGQAGYEKWADSIYPVLERALRTAA